MRDVASASSPAKALDGISWRQFESLVGEVFRGKGFSVVETRAGPDGGIDLILCKGNEKYLVQCKHWRAVKVGVPVVREFFGVMAAAGATGGFIVTSGHFTDDAKSFAQGRNIDLVENAELTRWIASARQSRSGLSPAEPDETPATSPRQGAGALCPACGAEMLQRTAKRGRNAGRKFWGCSRYPDCRGTLPI
jgi:restriction system protein